MPSTQTRPTDGEETRDRPPLPTWDVTARPLVYVVRFCGTEESSVASALRDSVGVLEAFLLKENAKVPDELIVVYRNRLPGAVALQVGYPVNQAVATKARGEVFAGTTPSGAMVEMLPGGALNEVLEAGAHFPEASTSFTWQSFRQEDLRPWRDFPSAPVWAPAGLAAETSSPAQTP